MIERRNIRHLSLCVIILVLNRIPYLYSSNGSPVFSSNNDELIRWSIMSAERSLQNMDHPLSDYINHWISINRILPLITNRVLIAKAKLIKLALLSRSLSSWAKWSRMPEYEDWLKFNSDIVYFIGDEDRGWFLRTAEYWRLFEDSKGLYIADRIAWEAANNPEPQLCESDLPCYFQALDRTYIKYLQLFPDGLYASLALENILAFCLNFKNSPFFRARLDELFKKASSDPGSLMEKDSRIIRRIIVNIKECLANYGSSVSSAISSQTNELFTKYLRSYIDKQGPQNGPSFTVKNNKQPEQAEDNNRNNLENLRYLVIFKYNLELTELIDIWNKLEASAASESNRALKAQSELLKIRCLKRIAHLATDNHNPSPSTAAWIAEHKQYFHNGILRLDIVWKSFNSYADLPISDDFAWEAINNVSIEPSFEREGLVYNFSYQLNDILKTFGRYLQLMPNGKYSSIALEAITNFLNSCLRQDDLRLPPFGLENISKSDYLSFQSTLKLILANSSNTRALRTIETLAAVQRSLIDQAP